MSGNRLGIEPSRVKVSMNRIEARVPPWVAAWTIPVSGAMPLLLRRQGRSAPAGILCRLLLRDIHRPVERQGNHVEHRSQLPMIAVAPPKMRRRATCIEKAQPVAVR